MFLVYNIKIKQPYNHVENYVKIKVSLSYSINYTKSYVSGDIWELEGDWR